jgi:membrane protein DedA with SNARE-associated domain
VPTLLSLISNLAVVVFLFANDPAMPNSQSLGVRLLPKYGYFAIVFAAFWEGEAVLMAAGWMCGAGYLDWRWTILAAAIGGSAGDQIYFYAAHDRAVRIINKSKRLSKWYPKISTFVLRHGTIGVLLSRFAAGLRITIPIICASAGMSPKKYSPLSLASGFAWASFWVAIMYQVGARVHG